MKVTEGTAILAGVVAGGGLVGVFELASGGLIFHSTAAGEGAGAGWLLMTMVAGLLVLVVTLLCAWALRLPRSLVLGGCSGAVSLMLTMTGYLFSIPI